jgi:hypothetical protein
MDFVSTYAAIVSTYAAIVSTGILVWSIYEYFDGKKGKLKIFQNYPSVIRTENDILYSYDVVNMTNRKIVLVWIDVHGGDLGDNGVFLADVTELGVVSIELVSDQKLPVILEGHSTYKLFISDKLLKMKINSPNFRSMKIRIMDAERNTFYSQKDLGEYRRLPT